MIRALRLSEYARKEGFGKLKELMDIFYCQAYSVWQGEVERSRLKTDAEQTFALLKQRPGLFARSLFANMLWFGPKETLTAFREVASASCPFDCDFGYVCRELFRSRTKKDGKAFGWECCLD